MPFLSFLQSKVLITAKKLTKSFLSSKIVSCDKFYWVSFILKVKTCNELYKRHFINSNPTLVHCCTNWSYKQTPQQKFQFASKNLIKVKKLTK